MVYIVQNNTTIQVLCVLVLVELSCSTKCSTQNKMKNRNKLELLPSTNMTSKKMIMNNFRLSHDHE